MARIKTAVTNLSLPFFFIIFFTALAIGLLIIYWSVTRPFCANSLSCKDSLSLKVENGIVGEFNGQKIMPPNIDLAEKTTSKKVLGETTQSGKKHIYVDLATQTVTAYQDNMLFMTAKVSTGKWHKTPTGEFTIWEKLRSTRMSGGTGTDYYNLPNVPYVMFFQGPGAPAASGFGFHGAYWHDNFGHAMSHGCINMRTVDIQKLYDWVGEDIGADGVAISIYGQAP